MRTTRWWLGLVFFTAACGAPLVGFPLCENGPCDGGVQPGVDAGSNDSGVATGDAGGSGQDAGTDDAGLQPDSGSSGDDAGVDAGQQVDAGTDTDAGAGTDAGAPSDGGSASNDAGAGDGGAPGDAGADTSPPLQVTFITPAANRWWNQDSYTVSWTTPADVGTSGVDPNGYRIELFSSAACSGSPTASTDFIASPFTTGHTLTSGSVVSFKVSARDHAGNRNTGACSSALSIDLVPPTAFNVTAPSGHTPWASTSYTFTWSSSGDALSGLDGGYTHTVYAGTTCTGSAVGAPFVTSTLSHSVTGLVNGQSYSTNVFVIDNAGNVTTTPCAGDLFISVGGAGPIITITSGNTANTKSPTPLTYTFTCAAGTDGGFGCTTNSSDYLCSCDNGANYGSCSGINGAAPGGPHQHSCPAPGAGNLRSSAGFKVSAKDSGGNSGSPATLGDYVWDQQGPTLTLTTANPGQNNAAMLVFGWSCSDGAGVGCSVTASDFTCTCPGASVTTCSAAASHTCSLALGAYLDAGTFSVVGKDTLGTASSAVSQVFDWDRTAPTTTCSGAPAWLTSTPLDATGLVGCVDTGTGCNSTQCSLNGGTFGACNSIILTEGATQNLRARGTDRANNTTSSGYGQCDFGVDMSTPSVNFTGGPTGTVYTNPSAFSWTASDALSGVASTQCQLDSSSFATCTSGDSFSVDGGMHTLSVRAVDNAGLTGSAATRSWTYVVPVLPSALSLSHTNNQRSFTVSWTLGVGNGGAGGCKLQYNSGSSWVDLGGGPYNCDATTSNAAASLLGDGFAALTWNLATGLSVRLVRTSDNAVLGAFPQTLKCDGSMAGSVNISTPNIDENCNRTWDDSTMICATCQLCDWGVRADLRDYGASDPSCSGGSYTTTSSSYCKYKEAYGSNAMMCTLYAGAAYKMCNNPGYTLPGQKYDPNSPSGESVINLGNCDPQVTDCPKCGTWTQYF